MAVARLAGCRGKARLFAEPGSEYGNDNDDVDAMASRVIDHYCDVLSKYSNFRRRILAGHILRWFPYNYGSFYRRDA